MDKTIITYESQHGTALKIAKYLSNKLNVEFINIDTPYMAEDLDNIDNIIMVFNFRGPYTAQLTKLYLDRMKNKLSNKNIILIGEGLFSEKEFPVVAEEISKLSNCKYFNKYFIKGQLRLKTLTKEEKHLLNRFSEITKMKITDMGDFKESDIDKIVDNILDDINNPKENKIIPNYEISNEWVCPICGYVHKEDNPPNKCPMCGVDGKLFKRK